MSFRSELNTRSTFRFSALHDADAGVHQEVAALSGLDQGETFMGFGKVADFHKTSQKVGDGLLRRVHNLPRAGTVLSQVIPRYPTKANRENAG